MTRLWLSRESASLLDRTSAKMAEASAYSFLVKWSVASWRDWCSWTVRGGRSLLGDPGSSSASASGRLADMTDWRTMIRKTLKLTLWWNVWFMEWWAWGQQVKPPFMLCLLTRLRLFSVNKISLQFPVSSAVVQCAFLIDFNSLSNRWLIIWFYSFEFLDSRFNLRRILFLVSLFPNQNHKR